MLTKDDEHQHESRIKSMVRAQQIREISYRISARTALLLLFLLGYLTVIS